MDEHDAHLMMHSRLFATPWLREPDLAAKLGITNARQIMATIQQHMQFPVWQGRVAHADAATQPNTPDQVAGSSWQGGFHLRLGLWIGRVWNRQTALGKGRP
jgi:hypothetical protein